MASTEIRPQHDPQTVTARAPDVVRWTGVIAGVVIGLGVFALLNALWWAIEYSAGNGWVVTTWPGCWVVPQPSPCCWQA